MTAWWTGSLVPFDLETDGVDPTDARIISACVAVCSPGMSAEVRTWLAKPERPIPDEAAALHGISTERAENEGLERAVVVEQIARALAGSPGDGIPVVGHNLAYDLTVLDREMRRTGVGSLGVESNRFASLGEVQVRIDGRTVGVFYVVDTMVLDKAVDPFRKGPPEGGRNRLTTVAEHYGVPIRGDAHTADADALAAGRIAWVIAKRCGMPADEVKALYADRRYPAEIARAFWTLGTLDLPNLNAYQQRMYREQAAGLVDYFTKNPDKGDPGTVSTSWPLQPVRESETA